MQLAGTARRRRRSIAVAGLVVGVVLATVGGAASPAPRQQADQPLYTNHLIDSHDPYLLMHAHNPVNWYPWGPEALAKAKRERKPIFVSIGFATCYWCHVAERELYSNPQIAALMNQWFVNIKVDCEQRPDIDRVYMRATQILTGGGAWPNNLFLTPDLEPFVAGSYYPPEDRGTKIGFPRVLQTVHDIWVRDPATIEARAHRVFQQMSQPPGAGTDGHGAALAPDEWTKEAVAIAVKRFDKVNGGFPSGATQFPQPTLLSLLLSVGKDDHDRAREMAATTLRAMAEGSVMDQLAGGFYRYAIEPTWSVPHFEKIVGDNAQLLGVYARAYALTGSPLFAQVARRTAGYLTSEMQAPGGGFYSAQDASSGGVEGGSYVWTRDAIDAVLGSADAKRFLELYRLTDRPKVAVPGEVPSGPTLRLDRQRAEALADKQQLTAALDALAPLREKLLAARRTRPQPPIDEKIVTADNALVVLGFVEAGRQLHEPALTDTAVSTAEWLWSHAYDPATRLVRHQTYHGDPGGDGFLDDYALLGEALLAVHRETNGAAWLDRARAIADAMLDRFAGPDGRLAQTWDVAGLVMPPPMGGDDVAPSGESAGVAFLADLAVTAGDARYAAAASRAMAPVASIAAAKPSDWSALVEALNRPSIRAVLTSKAMPAASFDSASHVHASGRFTRTTSGADLVVTMDIDPGYHVNANPASDPDLIPTTLTLAGQADLAVDYPAPVAFKAPFAPDGIDVYQGRVVLRAHLDAAPASWPAHATLRVQACNDRACFAPSTVDVAVSPPDK